MPDRERRRDDRQRRPLPDRVLALELAEEYVSRWRRDVTRRLSALEEDVEALKKADEIADAVAAKLANPEAGTPRPTVNVGGSLNWPQKIGGLVVGGLIVVDALRGLLGL